MCPLFSFQVEVHPLWRNDDLIQYCNSEGIHVSAYCPLGTPWTSAKAVIRRADPASQHPVIQQIAKKYNKHALHIIMRWGLQHGTSILAKSSNPQRIKVRDWRHSASVGIQICDLRIHIWEFRRTE